MEIIEFGNNRYEIGGYNIYAPNIATALKRYKEKSNGNNIGRFIEQYTEDRETSENLSESKVCKE